MIALFLVAQDLKPLKLQFGSAIYQKKRFRFIMMHIAKIYMVFIKN